MRDQKASAASKRPARRHKKAWAQKYWRKKALRRKMAAQRGKTQPRRKSPGEQKPSAAAKSPQARQKRGRSKNLAAQKKMARRGKTGCKNARRRKNDRWRKNPAASARKSGIMAEKARCAGQKSAHGKRCSRAWKKRMGLKTRRQKGRCSKNAWHPRQKHPNEKRPAALKSPRAKRSILKNLRAAIKIRKEKPPCGWQKGACTDQKGLICTKSR